MNRASVRVTPMGLDGARTAGARARVHAALASGAGARVRPEASGAGGWARRGATVARACARRGGAGAWASVCAGVTGARG